MRLIQYRTCSADRLQEMDYKYYSLCRQAIFNRILSFSCTSVYMVLNRNVQVGVFPRLPGEETEAPYLIERQRLAASGALEVFPPTTQDMP